MPIETIDRYSREDLRARPDDLFVFGDNMVRRGLGGQAKACRGEPNAVGVPTKWRPSSDSGAYFNDGDFKEVKVAIDSALARCAGHLNAGGTVVLPSAGVGSGLADLAKRAPMIHAYIERSMERLRQISSQSA